MSINIKLTRLRSLPTQIVILYSKRTSLLGSPFAIFEYQHICLTQPISKIPIIYSPI